MFNCVVDFMYALEEKSMVVNTDVGHLQEVAHLLRRAGFGGTKKEIEGLASDGYEAAVKKLMVRKKL